MKLNNIRIIKFIVILCGVNFIYSANIAMNTESSIQTLTPTYQSIKPSKSQSPHKFKNKNSNYDTNSKDTVILNFENSDIQSTIKAISTLSGKNFVIDPRVKGTVTIISDKPISKSDSYKVLETALRMQGFAVVEGDGVIKVLPENDAKTYGTQVINAQSPLRNKIGDQVVTKAFIIEHGSPSQLANALRPMIAQSNAITVYQNSNALIITDYASNINRLSQVINQLTATTEHKSAPTIVKLQHAIASDVFPVLQSYVQGGGSSGNTNSGSGSGGDAPMVSITVDVVNNSIIIYSTVKDRVDEIKALALQLDKNAAESNSNLHVVYLRNADAAHIADVLRVIASGQENADLTPSSSLATFKNEPASMFQSTGSGGSGGGSTSSSSGSSLSSGSYNKSSSSTSSNSQSKDQAKILIQAEPTTNSLIIQAPDAIYHNFRMIISMLDIRRAQIMIEAMIVDVNSTTSGQFGIQWAVGGGNNQLGAFGIGNYAVGDSNLSNVGTTAYTLAQMGKGSGGSAATKPPPLPQEMMIGLVSGTVTLGGTTIPSIGALADMISANSSANILSRPTLITLDNEEAKIMVGQDVPVPNGSYQSSAAAVGNLVSTYSRTNIGTFLDIKPLITQSGSIQLDLYQEDSSLDSSTKTNTAGPSFLKRTIRATILVDDGQIIAIGGMTRDDVAIVKTGVPFLSDIPYLGWLFSWQSRVHEKKNLVLFLRPVIIRNAEGYRALTNMRYQYVIDQQTMVQAKGNLMLPDINPVTLDNQLPYSSVLPVNKDNTTKLNGATDMQTSQENMKISNVNSNVTLPAN